MCWNATFRSIEESQSPGCTVASRVGNYSILLVKSPQFENGSPRAPILLDQKARALITVFYKERWNYFHHSLMHDSPKSVPTAHVSTLPYSCVKTRPEEGEGYNSPGDNLVTSKMSLIAIVDGSRCFLSVQLGRQ